MSTFKGERTLAVVGATAILLLGFDSVTYAATGGSLLLGKINKAGAITTVQNTGSGPALRLTTKSTVSAPFVTNAKGKVTNLFADKAATALRANTATTATTATNAGHATTADSATTAGTATSAATAANAANANKLGGQTLTQVVAAATPTALTFRDDVSRSADTDYSPVLVPQGTYLLTFSANVELGSTVRPETNYMSCASYSETGQSLGEGNSQLTTTDFRYSAPSYANVVTFANDTLIYNYCYTGGDTGWTVPILDGHGPTWSFVRLGGQTTTPLTTIP